MGPARLWLSTEFLPAAAGKNAIAVEHHDIDGDRETFDHAPRRIARRVRNGIAKNDTFGGRMRKGFRSGVGRDNAFLECARTPDRRRKTGEGLQIDGTASRMQVEQALGELRHLGDAARNRHPRHRMAAQKFKHAADKISHVDQGDFGQEEEFLHGASEVEPVAPAMWPMPAARATAMPLWIEWIHAAHE